VGFRRSRKQAVAWVVGRLVQQLTAVVVAIRLNQVEEFVLHRLYAPIDKLMLLNGIQQEETLIQNSRGDLNHLPIVIVIIILIVAHNLTAHHLRPWWKVSPHIRGHHGQESQGILGC